MNYEFDPPKDQSSLSKHGLSLADAEPRFETTDYIGNCLHVMVFCLRTDAVRVISLRKANKREEKIYAKT
ncbi:MAG: BrnT family toxin [Burkholderiales bacterium]|nr:BrnT family toxin [Burkholderiales bacterium]